MPDHIQISPIARAIQREAEMLTELALEGGPAAALLAMKLSCMDEELATACHFGALRIRIMRKVYGQDAVDAAEKLSSQQQRGEAPITGEDSLERDRRNPLSQVIQ